MSFIKTGHKLNFKEFNDYWAKKGIYAYDIDMDSDNEILVAIPTNPINIDNLPANILELLTEF
jgi:hypothetical protein